MYGFSENDWLAQHATVIFSLSDKAVESPTGAIRIYFVIYGTGFRGPSTVTATLPGHDVPVIYAGPQGAAGLGAKGLDQVNIGLLPSSLAGRGSVTILLTADGLTANAVQANFPQDLKSAANPKPENLPP